MHLQGKLEQPVVSHNRLGFAESSGKLQTKAQGFQRGPLASFSSQRCKDLSVRFQTPGPRAARTRLGVEASIPQEDRAGDKRLQVGF